MVELETVQELCECLADKLGIYGNGPKFDVHSDNCKCRICFVTTMEDRIREAVENDKYLNAIEDDKFY